MKEGHEQHGVPNESCSDNDSYTFTPASGQGFENLFLFRLGMCFLPTGDAVSTDEVIAQIETDKVTLDVRAPTAGLVQAVKVLPASRNCKLVRKMPHAHNPSGCQSPTYFPRTQ